MIRPAAAACVIALVLASCAPPRAPVATSRAIRTEPCRLFEPPAPRRAIPYADLSAVKAYRSYVAVTGVQPLGHHFTVWYTKMAPAMLYLRARRDAAGRLLLVTQDGGWGGLAVPPRKIPPLPPEVAALAQEVKAELCKRCNHVCKSRMAYDGFRRIVFVREFIARNIDGQGSQRRGWQASAAVPMDASLSRIIGTVDRGVMGGILGVIQLPADAQWLQAPSIARPGQLLSPARIDQLAAGIAEAARRYDSKSPPRSIASLVPANSPIVPESRASRVFAEVTLQGRPSRRAGTDRRRLLVPLDLHDAVFTGGTMTEAEVTLGQARYKLKVQLAPLTPLSSTPRRSRASSSYHGTLTLSVEDNRGHTWQRSYPVLGQIYLEGEVVVAISGFQIPGKRCPSSHCAARSVQLPVAPPYNVVDLLVAAELFLDFSR